MEDEGEKQSIPFNCNHDCEKCPYGMKDEMGNYTCDRSKFIEECIMRR